MKQTFFTVSIVECYRMVYGPSSPILNQLQHQFKSSLQVSAVMETLEASV